MRHIPGSSEKIVLRTGLTIAALATVAVTGACSASGNQAKLKFNPKLSEPICHGVSLQQIDHDNFKVIPELSQPFSHSNNVRTFLTPVTPPVSPPPDTLPQTSGGNFSAGQIGPAYETTFQSSPQPDEKLVMFDFQANKVPNLEELGGVPAAVPEVDCPAFSPSQKVSELFH